MVGVKMGMMTGKAGDTTVHTYVLGTHTSWRQSLYLCLFQENI